MERNTVAILFQSCVLLLALAAAMAGAGNDDAKFNLYPKTHVVIVNGFATDMLHIKCRSRDDDLGFHNLSVGQNFEFTFHPNFWHSTRIWCNFWWNGGHQSGDVYWWDHRFPQDYCVSDRHCTWKAQEDGIYSYNAAKGIFEKWYSWVK
ncbi:hypothetical protein HS088_TW12G00612 [Tripterygium wilfordii]|uniref:S-protein homolog n=1 Tax=Tripterygium wilfordii TaxID=458696 RepID=A0A7J7CZ95_TRIWF|nr:hypothetical protein HS088_TW12G00612 [Tripterygium wilfordii]